MRGVGTA
jgi:intraflagellar transport protein 88